MTDNERNDVSAVMKEQADKAHQIIADAEKKGYLPEIELSDSDKWDIEQRQTTFEERLALRTEERNQEYLKYREVWGKRYANPNKENFTVGNWSKEICDNYALRAACNDKNLSREEQLENKKKLAQMTENMTYLNTSHLHSKFDWTLKDSDVVHTNKGEDSSYSPLAYNFSKQTLFINDTNMENAKNNEYRPLAEAAKGNPVALDCAIYHELNHKQNWEHDGLGQLSYTPTNAVKGVVLTEKVSLSVEYLNMAQEYHKRKANGETTIKYNDGTEKPLESLLDIYPGFKETTEKYGTDISNPEVKREFVQTAMNYWEQERGKDYVDQIEIEARWGNKYFNQCSFAKQTELLRDEDKTYEKVSAAMLKDVNIGGTKMDLTDCKDLLNTVTNADVKQIIDEHNKNDYSHDEQISLHTYQEYQEINQYLESIGKKTDAEKMEHIAKTIQKASFSLESHDKTLENIMLSHNPEITSGPLNIEKTDKAIVASFAGNKYDITEFATPQKSKPQKQMPTVQLGNTPLNDR